MYYIVSDEGQIVDSGWHCLDLDELREFAQELKCGLWILQGEHTGLEVEKPQDDTSKN